MRGGGWGTSAQEEERKRRAAEEAEVLRKAEEVEAKRLAMLEAAFARRERLAALQARRCAAPSLPQPCLRCVARQRGP